LPGKGIDPEGTVVSRHEEGHRHPLARVPELLEVFLAELPGGQEARREPAPLGIDFLPGDASQDQAAPRLEPAMESKVSQSIDPGLYLEPLPFPQARL
jgi:hypothetical protein